MPLTTQTEIYLKAASDLNAKIGPHYPIDGPDLHQLILKAEPAIREQLACLERLGEELFARSNPKDPAPVMLFPAPYLSAAKAARLYRENPNVNPNDLPRLFHLINNSMVELVLLTEEKKKILWRPNPGDDQKSSKI